MRRRGVLVNGAVLCDEILNVLETVLRGEEDQLPNLADAAARSGYSADHLGRMIREGKIRNLGLKGSPRVRAGDLPRRLGSVRARTGSYDPVADAREIARRVVGRPR